MFERLNFGEETEEQNGWNVYWSAGKQRTIREEVQASDYQQYECRVYDQEAIYIKRTCVLRHCFVGTKHVNLGGLE